MRLAALAGWRRQTPIYQPIFNTKRQFGSTHRATRCAGSIFFTLRNEWLRLRLRLRLHRLAIDMPPVARALKEARLRLAGWERKGMAYAVVKNLPAADGEEQLALW